MVLLHGHGGNYALHAAFVTRMLEYEKPYAVYSIPPFGAKLEELGALLESNQWGHACEMETSMVLVAAPKLVNLKRLGKKTFPPKPGPEVGAALTPVDWTARHPEMAVGEPHRATKPKGEKILSLWADEVVGILRRIKRDKVTVPSIRNYARKVNSQRAKKERRRAVKSGG